MERRKLVAKRFLILTTVFAICWVPYNIATLLLDFQRTVLRHLISQYLPPDGGNSFCLVVKIRDSGPKGARLKSTHCHRQNSTRGCPR
ncbi:hypothetical protein AVEN_24608-1 [Araneus ventricosus]|uniref:G-protein coupled receptors family 1 profile domain-containing protein n=1 Tax=Araneus ventricosus TaxID=182803 RepID=A0A4Y2ILK4_ARAVE|nr:hypothetical protein AVEN_24608-1 [Araneus ventricosus]